MGCVVGDAVVTERRSVALTVRVADGLRSTTTVDTRALPNHFYRRRRLTSLRSAPPAAAVAAAACLER